MSGNGLVIVRSGTSWLRFAEPDSCLSTCRLSEVTSCLLEADRALARGWHLAGYLAYEAAPAFDPALVCCRPGPYPLMWFGLYRTPSRVRDLPVPRGPFRMGPWMPSLGVRAYGRAIQSIKSELRQGNSYQVNFTLRLKGSFRGDTRSCFRVLYARQPTGYAAYLETEAVNVCSWSPELFFAVDGDRIVSKPMKGTAPRGGTAAVDLRFRERLRQSEKNRAENVMIVDMIRNDLGRVARPGSVRVSHPFEVEGYPTVWQMTSTVTARTRASLHEILHAIFPCASVTGAPKPNTMRIIRRLERTPRGLYTGAIGYASPGRRMRFNVAIRTLVVPSESSRAVYGVGGGVVWDSSADAEYAECMDKARLLLDSGSD